jgi:hypothetical protein
MLHPLPDLGEWPPLEWEQWKDTAETLHMYMQIVGKTLGEVGEFEGAPL